MLQYEIQIIRGDSDKMIELCGKIEKIQIELYSYKISTKELIEFIDKITKNYIEKIENNRKNKLFLYTLVSDLGEDSKSLTWMERSFISTRNFENFTFDGKDELFKKINFFINNKDWYYKEGHPYTLGNRFIGTTRNRKNISNKINSKHDETSFDSNTVK